jgi:hypothetical protein
MVIFVSTGGYNQIPGITSSQSYEMATMEDCDSVKNHLEEIMKDDEALRYVKTSTYCFKKGK